MQADVACVLVGPVIDSSAPDTLLQVLFLAIQLLLPVTTMNTSTEQSSE